MKTRRPQSRKIEILDAALLLSRSYGYQTVTREQIANQAGCSEGAVSAHFGTMIQLRRAIMSAAVARGDNNVIAQGLSVGDTKAQSISLKVKREALKTIL